jgi:hypothetical protein
MSDLDTSNDAKVRETTCEYADDVDDINAIDIGLLGHESSHPRNDPSYRQPWPSGSKLAQR